jgi:hypothetical protein
VALRLQHAPFKQNSADRTLFYLAGQDLEIGAVEQPEFDLVSPGQEPVRTRQFAGPFETEIRERKSKFEASSAAGTISNAVNSSAEELPAQSQQQQITLADREFPQFVQTHLVRARGTE